MSNDPPNDTPNDTSNGTNPLGSDGSFQTTHWSMVLSAGRRGSEQSDRALEKLCRVYWQPLYAYVRRRVDDVHEAQDMTQAFFARMLEKQYLAGADPKRGRFRAFLITAFKHFLANQWEKAKAQKRGGGRTRIALDFENADQRYGREPDSGLTAEQWYERQWAVTLLELTMQRLAEEFAERDKSEQFQQLKGFAIGDHAGTTYADAAAHLGTTEAAAKMAAHRLRRRFRELLRDEIAQTVATPEEIDDEIRSLFVILSRQ